MTTDSDFDPNESDPWAELSGAQVLDEIHSFLGRFIIYPSEAAHVAHTLWIAHTHKMDLWDSTPRLAFLSPEPASGKSRALEITELLVPRPIHSVNVTPAYLFRKVSDEAGAPTILYDEVDTIFGPKARDNEEIRGMLNAGHRKGAMAGRCVIKGKIIETEELPAYCAVALAGLHDLPDTIASRSIIINMKRRAPGERVEEFRQRMHKVEGDRLNSKLERFMKDVEIHSWPERIPGVEDRDADMWEPLFVIADEAGDHWPERARCFAVSLVSDAKEKEPTFNVLLLTDIHQIFKDKESLFTEDMLKALIEIEESPWGDIRGKALTDRSLAKRLGTYGITSKQIRREGKTKKGYAREDFVDAWTRYVNVGVIHLVAETSETNETYAPPSLALVGSTQ